MLILLGALVCSGAAGLAYQVLWQRQLSLSFGVTTYAAGTVLAGFMAGLALGSVVAGRVASRAARPLRLLALAEISIAATALALPAAFARLPAVVETVQPLVSDSAGALTAVRFVVAFTLLLVPTAFMGATLPLVAASGVVRARNAAARVGAAYASNTAGAIAGALVTGFVLIGAVGIRGATLAAAAANLTAAALAAWLSVRVEAPAARVEGHRTVEPRARAALAPSQRVVLLVLTISGLASLALEVVWFRILTQFVTATTYAFSTMLATVLGGIAAGGWLAARMLRRERDWMRTFARLQWSTALAVVASMVAQGWSYQAGWRTSATIQASVLTILPAALLLGVAFPVGLRLWIRRGGAGAAADQRIAGDLGLVYAANVGGAILGATAGGFLLIPWLGTRISLMVCAALFAASGICVAATAGRSSVRGAEAWCWTAAFVAVMLLVPDPFAVTSARRHGADETLIWRDDGAQSSVAVHESPDGRRVLYLDGLHQANDTPEMLRTHRQIGHLPMALHPNPRRALVIGLGGGATAGAVSQHVGTQVDVVELSDSVRRGARFFAHANYDVLQRPNVHFRVDDGRNYLLTTTRKYDVVTADIIQPMHAGAGLVYSREYFELARRVLNEDGLMLQWVGHRPDSHYKLIARTFTRVFPHATAWVGGTLLVGSLKPLSLQREAFERHRAHEVTRRALDDIGLDSFDTLLSWYAGGPKALAAFVGDGPVLSDDRPLLEFHRSLPHDGRQVDLSALDRRLDPLRVRD